MVFDDFSTNVKRKELGEKFIIFKYSFFCVNW